MPTCDRFRRSLRLVRRGDLLVLLLTFVLSTLAGAVSQPPGKRLLLLVGSNTLGEHAIPELARGWLQQEKQVGNPTIQSNGDIVYISGALPNGSPVYVEVRATGSGDCFKSLINSGPGIVSCDIGMSSRRATEKEATTLQDKFGYDVFERGSEPGEGCEHPVGMDGLAIIVNKANPLSRISFRELKSIYSAQTKTWSELREWKSAGGEPSPAIAPVRRKEPSGTLDFFKERIRPEGTAMTDLKQIAAYTSSTELAAFVAQNPSAIGFVGESYAMAPGVKRLQVYDDSEHAMMKPEEAVFPDRTAVRRGLYPLSRFVYLYTPHVPLNPDTKPFIRFALSEEGQSIIGEQGYLVPIEGTTFHITKAETPTAVEDQLTKETGKHKKKIILRLHGSNTVGAECAVGLAYDFLVGKALEAKRPIKIEDETSELETPEGEKALAHDVMCDLDGDGLWETVEIRPTGSSDAFRDLNRGLCDVGMSSRPISAAEKRDLAATCGDLSTPGSQFVLGIDALAIVVAKENPVTQLTLEQLRSIFVGDVVNWKEVGGPDLPINVHARPERSGTAKTFSDSVLSGRPLSQKAQRHAENSTLAEVVSKDPAGIGFVPMKNIGPARALEIGQEGSRNFAAPSEVTVRSAQYPAKLCRFIYLYVPEEKPQSLSLAARMNWPNARLFAEQSQGWRGQAVVASSGFIPETATIDEGEQARRQPDEPIEKYIPRLRDLEKKILGNQLKLMPKLVNGEICPQLLFNFNEDNLTAESRNIIDRKLRAWVKIYPGVVRRGLIAEGWADSDGTDEACIRVSQQRAQTVSNHIAEALGLPVIAVGRGKSFEPPNTSEENKQLNRRVVIKVASTASVLSAPASNTSGKKKQR